MVCFKFRAFPLHAPAVPYLHPRTVDLGSRLPYAKYTYIRPWRLRFAAGWPIRGNLPDSLKIEGKKKRTKERMNISKTFRETHPKVLVAKFH